MRRNNPSRPTGGSFTSRPSTGRGAGARGDQQGALRKRLEHANEQNRRKPNDAPQQDDQNSSQGKYVLMSEDHSEIDDVAEALHVLSSVKNLTYRAYALKYLKGLDSAELPDANHDELDVIQVLSAIILGGAPEEKSPATLAMSVLLSRNRKGGKGVKAASTVQLAKPAASTHGVADPEFRERIIAVLRNRDLHSHAEFEEHDLSLLREVWEDAEEDGVEGIEQDTFIELFDRILCIRDTDFTGVLFSKMDHNGDGSLTWDEFLKYLYHEGSAKEAAQLGGGVAVLPKQAKYEPGFCHENTVDVVRCCERNGLVVTAGRDKTVRLWDLGKKEVKRGRGAREWQYVRQRGGAANGVLKAAGATKDDPHYCNHEYPHSSCLLCESPFFPGEVMDEANITQLRRRRERWPTEKNLITSGNDKHSATSWGTDVAFFEQGDNMVLSSMDGFVTLYSGVMKAPSVTEYRVNRWIDIYNSDLRKGKNSDRTEASLLSLPQGQPLCLATAATQTVYMGDMAGGVTCYSILDQKQMLSTAVLHKRMGSHGIVPEFVTRLKYVSEISALLSSGMDGRLLINNPETLVPLYMDRPLHHLKSGLSHEGTGGDTNYGGGGCGILSFAYSKQHTFIATAGADRMVNIWDGLTQMKLAAMAGHVGPVVDVVQNDRNHQLITASSQRVIKVWDVRKFQCIQTVMCTQPHKPENTLTSLAFDEKQQLLLAAIGKDIGIWEVDASGTVAGLVKDESDELSEAEREAETEGHGRGGGQAKAKEGVTTAPALSVPPNSGRRQAMSVGMLGRRNTATFSSQIKMTNTPPVVSSAMSTLPALAKANKGGGGGATSAITMPGQVGRERLSSSAAAAASLSAATEALIANEDSEAHVEDPESSVHQPKEKQVAAPPQELFTGPPPLSCKDRSPYNVHTVALLYAAPYNETVAVRRDGEVEVRDMFSGRICSSFKVDPMQDMITGVRITDTAQQDEKVCHSQPIGDLRSVKLAEKLHRYHHVDLTFLTGKTHEGEEAKPKPHFSRPEAGPGAAGAGASGGSAENEDNTDVTAVCLGFIDRTLIVAHYSGHVMQYNFNNSNRLHTFKRAVRNDGHGFCEINALRWLPGKGFYVLAGAGADRCVHLWPAPNDTARPVKKLAFHKDDIVSLDLFCDTTLFVGSADGRVTTWKLDTTQLSYEIPVTPRELDPSFERTQRVKQLQRNQTMSQRREPLILPDHLDSCISQILVLPKLFVVLILTDKGDLHLYEAYTGGRVKLYANTSADKGKPTAAGTVLAAVADPECFVSGHGSKDPEKGVVKRFRIEGLRSLSGASGGGPVAAAPGSAASGQGGHGGTGLQAAGANNLTHEHPVHTNIFTSAHTASRTRVSVVDYSGQVMVKLNDVTYDVKWIGDPSPPADGLTIQSIATDRQNGDVLRGEVVLSNGSSFENPVDSGISVRLVREWHAHELGIVTVMSIPRKGYELLLTASCCGEIRIWDDVAGHLLVHMHDTVRWPMSQDLWSTGGVLQTLCIAQEESAKTKAES